MQSTTKQCSAQLTPRATLRRGKEMLGVWGGQGNIVRLELFKCSETLNGHLYLEQFQYVHKNGRKLEGVRQKKTKSLS